jgi:hypothetical protein
VGFGPVGDADLGADDTRLRGARQGGLLTRRTREGVVLVGGGCLRLTLEGEVKDAVGQGLLECADGLFELGQGGAPGRPRLPVEAVHQEFGNPLEVKSNVSNRIRVGSG